MANYEDVPEGALDFLTREKGGAAARAGSPDAMAWNKMKEGDPDKYITGGAIEYSKYEMDMKPADQKKYKTAVLQSLDSAYKGDPHKGKLGFKDWLKNLKPELVKERAKKWDELRGDKEAIRSLDPKEYKLIEESGLLQNLLNMHTGELDDVGDIIGSEDPPPIEEFKMSNKSYRK